MHRNQSLDALRGFAILAMVLASSIAFGILPGWMYHAQEPPPGHLFNPGLPGITWVDLVFPFFLFSMGAAFPLAFHKRIQSGEPTWKLIFHITQRYILLVIFAIFTLHARAGVISAAPGTEEQFLSIACFILLFFMYYKWEKEKSSRMIWGIKSLSFLMAITFLFVMPFADGKGVQLHHSDIIIIVLANMAFFGSLIWLGTRNYPVLRIALLPFVMAIFLASDTEGSWNKILFDWSPFDWMYQFYYLKYLFIILPATLAGEWLLSLKEEKLQVDANGKKSRTATAFVCIVLILLNVLFLYLRLILLNLFITAIIIALLFSLLKRNACNHVSSCHKRLAMAGSYLLFLGLFFEAFEGGVKKDPSTYSYYFITGGLAFFALLAFEFLELSGNGKTIRQFLASNGKNPMVAYVTGNLLLLPLLNITGAIQFFNLMGSNVWAGVLRGFLFTGIVSLITIWFVKKKWYWKT
jgi:predicted acyltransferase